MVVVQEWLIIPCTIEVPVTEQNPRTVVEPESVLEVTLATDTSPTAQPGGLPAAGLSEQPKSHLLQ